MRGKNDVVLTKNKEKIKMKEPISIDPPRSIVQILTNYVDWSVLDDKALQEIIKNPEETGRHFTEFLKNGGRISKTIKINRSKPFDFTTFINNIWSIEKIEEQDERAIALTSINPAEIMLISTLEKEIEIIGGEDKLRRLKEKRNYILLDIAVLRAILENQSLIPLNWRDKINGNIRFIFFDGTILRDRKGRRCVMYIYWSDDHWGVGCEPLTSSHGIKANDLSAVIPCTLAA